MCLFDPTQRFERSLEGFADRGFFGSAKIPRVFLCDFRILKVEKILQLQTGNYHFRSQMFSESQNLLYFFLYFLRLLCHFP